MMLEVFTGGYVATNGYLLQKGKTTILIDAPAGSFEWLQEKGIAPDYLLLTHQHFDHVEDAHLFPCPIYAYSPFSRSLIRDKECRENWGLPVSVPDFEVDEVLEGISQLPLGDIQFDLLHVPGHSPDSLVYSLPQAKLALVGDTLFAGGVGRTDLPGGDEQLLFNGIREKLLTLSPTTQIYPGHGPATSPAEEATNPFLH